MKTELGKWLVSILIILSIISSCGVIKPTLPPSSDSTVVHVIDSIAWHDSTIFHVVPKEIYNDYTSLLDTLKLNTSYSEFESWVDTNSNVLKGTAKNIVDKVPVQIKWKEKIVYKDSIKVVKEPYPVEVEKVIRKAPWYNWILWPFAVFGLLSLLLLAVKIYLKFYGVK